MFSERMVWYSLWLLAGVVIAVTTRWAMESVLMPDTITWDCWWVWVGEPNTQGVYESGRYVCGR